MHAYLSRSLLTVFVFAVSLALTAACGSRGSAGDRDGGNGDNIDGGGDQITCVGIGELCESTIECCGGRACEPDGTGTRRCSETLACTPVDGSCTQASQCCSLSCDGQVCLGTGGLCKPSGTDCSAGFECCSNLCDGTCQPLGEGCATMGETCSSEGVDQNCCSLNCVNFGTEGSPDLRCAGSSACGARGEICVEASDCCSGVCDDGRCPTQNQVQGQRFAGEPCLVDSACASYACASAYPGGPKVCQFLGGCRPAGEICSEDWQCCSDPHIQDGGQFGFCGEDLGTGKGCEEHGGVDGLSICGLNEGDKEIGEICRDTDGKDVHKCCPDIPETCQQSLSGVWRCAGPDGFGDDVCIPDGDPCQTADQCCNKVCAPHEDPETGETVLLCGECVPVDGACTTSADCCTHTCENGVCGGEEAECIPLGAACETHEDCCSGFCSNGFCSTILH